MKAVLWLGFAVAFLLLVLIRVSDHKPQAIAATSATLAHTFDPRQPLWVPAATVIRARTDARGNDILKLQLPDGAQPTLVIPPTVDAQLPSPGSTIEFTAVQLGKNALTLQRHADLKVLTPGYHDNGAKRQRLGAYVHVTDLTSKGGLQATLYDTHDQWIASAVVLADCAKEVRPGWSLLYGYYTPDRVFIVEDVL